VKAEVILPDRKHASLGVTLPIPSLELAKSQCTDFHDLDNLGDPDKDVAISCSSRFVARLYDQKKSCASSHHNINKLQVKLGRLDAKNP
jgi:hypothetical protein